MRQLRRLGITVLAASLVACATQKPLLNSERIEQRFGNYGIDVLSGSDTLRRSNLYSLEDGVPVCRTYAVVQFNRHPDASYATEHRAVVAGGSLGQVFKDNGWQVEKKTLHIGDVDLGSSSSKLKKLMHLGAHDRVVAVHTYQLTIAKDDNEHMYATIVEAHHPDYLSRSDLIEIYPEGVAAEHSDSAPSLVSLLLSDG